MNGHAHRQAGDSHKLHHLAEDLKSETHSGAICIEIIFMPINDGIDTLIMKWYGLNRNAIFL